MTAPSSRDESVWSSIGRKAEPHVSFITTVHNGARYLENCVRWVLATRWPSFEMIIVDDGSEDETRVIGEHLAKTDSRIRFFAFGRLGRGTALNRAITLARGEIIAVQDVDDYCMPNRLGATVPVLLSDQNIAFVSGKVVRVRARKNVEGVALALRPSGQSELLDVLPSDLYAGKSPVAHPGIVYRKQSWQAIGGYRADSCIEDLELYFSLLSIGRGVIVNEVVNIIYVDPCSAMKKLITTSQYCVDFYNAQKRARSTLNIPKMHRIYDLLPLYFYVHGMLHALRHRLSWARCF